MKRVFVLSLIVLLLVAALAGCGRSRARRTPVPPTELPVTATAKPTATLAPPTETPQPTPVPATPTATPWVETVWVCPDKPATVVLWHSYQGAQLDALSAVLGEYAETCTGVQVDAIYKPDVLSALLDAPSEEKTPQVIVERNRNLGRLADGGRIAALDAYVERSALDQTYVGTAATAAVYDGQIYGLPLSMHTFSLVYNRDLIHEDELPPNTDALLARAATWDRTDYYFIYDVTDPYFSSAWWQAAGVTILDGEGHPGFASAAGHTAGNYIEALRSVIPNKIDRGIVDTLFRAGRAPIIIEDQAYLAGLRSEGINAGAALLPIFSPSQVRGAPFVDVDCLMLTSDVTDQDVATAAVNAMRFLTDVGTQVDLAMVGGMLPANQVAAGSAEVQALPDVAILTAQATEGKPVPTSPLMDALWEPMSQGLQCIWSGISSVEKCVDRIQSLAEENLVNLPAGQ